MKQAAKFGALEGPCIPSFAPGARWRVEGSDSHCDGNGGSWRGVPESKRPAVQGACGPLPAASRAPADQIITERRAAQTLYEWERWRTVSAP